MARFVVVLMFSCVFIEVHMGIVGFCSVRVWDDRAEYVLGLSVPWVVW